MVAAAATGQLSIWQHGIVWVGTVGGPTSVHAHYAVQITLALEGRVRYCVPAEDEWRAYRGAVLSSDCLHAFDGRDASKLVALFLSPESATGRALTRRYAGPHGIGLIPDPQLGPAIDALAACLHEPHVTSARLIETAQDVVRMLAADAAPPVPTDARVLRAIEYLGSDIGTRISLRRIAAVVQLSPSRFRHLFAEQTGVPISIYMLWLRLNRAMEIYASGESLTTAAHDAGFADSAHLSRTFRRMFGLPPGMVRLHQTAANLPP